MSKINVNPLPLFAFGFGVVLGLCFAVNVGIIPESNRLQDECEKDLPRNQVCEMVYIKPNLEVNNE